MKIRGKTVVIPWPVIIGSFIGGWFGLGLAAAMHLPFTLMTWAVTFIGWVMLALAVTAFYTWKLRSRHHVRVTPIRAGLDMRTTPVDNPLDWRADGSIRKGDPAYDVMWEIMKSGKPLIMTQRPDGTWKVKEVDE